MPGRAGPFEGREHAGKREPAELSGLRLENADARGFGAADLHAELDQPRQNFARVFRHHLGEVLDRQLLAEEVGSCGCAIGELLSDEHGGDWIRKLDL